MADPFTAIAFLSSLIPGIAELTKQPVAPAFTSEAEYGAAADEYRGLDEARRKATPEGKRIIERRMLELSPSIQQWEATQERETFRKKGVEIGLERLGEAGVRGERAIRRGQFARGLRGRGEVERPLREMRREIAERRSDIERGEVGGEMIQRQQQEALRTQQQFEQYGQETELFGQLGQTALGAVGEFRPGGAFGGPTSAERAQENINALMMRQVSGGKPLELGFTGANAAFGGPMRPTGFNIKPR